MDVNQFDKLQGADKVLNDLAQKAAVGQLGSITIIWGEKVRNVPQVHMYNVATVDDLKDQALGLQAAQKLLQSKIVGGKTG